MEGVIESLVLCVMVVGSIVTAGAVYAYLTRCAWCKGTGWCVDPSDTIHVPQRCPECHLGRRL